MSQDKPSTEVVPVPPGPDTKSETAIQPYMIRPVVKVEEALAAWKEYQNLKTQLADKGDFVKIQGRDHPTKQYANKLSKFFGLSLEIVKAERETTSDRDFVWHIWARATAPNGQFRDGDGHCSSDERKFSHLQHDVYATAVTRAKNRAILELAGFGEVSAEEMGDRDWSQERRSGGGGSDVKERGTDSRTGPAPSAANVRSEGPKASVPADNKPSASKNTPKSVSIVDGRYTDDAYPPVSEITLPDGIKVQCSRYKVYDLYERMKNAIGEERYYAVLGAMGYKQKTDVPDEELHLVYAMLAGEWKKLRGAKK